MTKDRPMPPRARRLLDKARERGLTVTQTFAGVSITQYEVKSTNERSVTCVWVYVSHGTPRQSVSADEYTSNTRKARKITMQQAHILIAHGIMA